MADRFKNHSPGLTSPGSKIVAVSANDSTDLPGGICRALLVGTAGVADIIDGEGNAVSGVPLQAGYNPIRVTRVKSTNLAASSIFAIY